jgi:hypothetical protein
MSFSCSTTDFPRLSSFEDAQAHWDRTKPWRGESQGAPRPIGSRATNQRHKNMRVLPDGSIAYCLHATDCVTWHPDGDVTVQGYASISTTAFVNHLVPSGVSHGQGPKHDWEPILTLRGGVEPYGRGWWGSGRVIQCSKPVRLHYNAETSCWEPVDMDALEPFMVPRIDRKAARAVSREYHLPMLTTVIHAAIALADIPHPEPSPNPMGAIMEALREERYIDAIARMPRSNGWSRGAFGREPAPRGALQPGFLTRLRNHIYDHEGVIERRPERVLTPASHRKYVADSRKY